jgi:hypothetical protein
MNRTLVAALVAVALVAPPLGTAIAQPATSAAAREQFASAQKAFDAKSYDAALTQFRKLVTETGSPNARLYVARSLRELGNVVEAYDEMALTVREATARAESEPKYTPTRDAAAAELALLDPKVGKLVVAIAEPGPGTKVTLNGKEVPADRLGSPITVEPGTITVLATSPGTAGMRQNATVKAGETKTVTLTLSTDAKPAEPEPDAAPPTDVPGDDRQTESGGAVRIAGFVTAGVGVAGFALFAIAGLTANSKYSTLEEECGPPPCTNPKYADTIDDGKMFDTLANVGLVVGAVGVTAGVAMIIFGGPTKTSTTAVELTPTGMRVRGTF